MRERTNRPRGKRPNSKGKAPRRRVLSDQQLAQVRREAERTKARPRYRLPRSWWREDVAERMAAYIEVRKAAAK